MARRRSKEYRRKKSQHRLHTEIRLRKVGAKPTREEMEEAYEHIRDTQRVPRGWKLAIVEWSHAANASKGWIEGDLSDVFSDMETVLPYLEESLHVGIDRKKSKPESDIWEILITMAY